MTYIHIYMTRLSVVQEGGVLQRTTTYEYSTGCPRSTATSRPPAHDRLDGHDRLTALLNRCSLLPPRSAPARGSLFHMGFERVRKKSLVSGASGAGENVACGGKGHSDLHYPLQRQADRESRCCDSREPGESVWPESRECRDHHQECSRETPQR